MTTDKQRESFEKWVVDTWGLDPQSKRLTDATVLSLHNSWAAWQAAVSQQPVGEEELASFIATTYNLPDYAMETDGCTELALSLLARFNISARGK